MNTYQRQLLDKLINELTDKPLPNIHAAQMLAAEFKGAMQATCSTCGGSQMIDSGGVTPWGEGIDAACPECLSRSRKAEIAQKPTPDADGWVENSGVMPDCAITAVRLRCGEIRNTDNKRDVLWHFAGDKKQRMINHHKSYDVTHYRPA